MEYLDGPAIVRAAPNVRMHFAKSAVHRPSVTTGLKVSELGCGRCGGIEAASTILPTLPDRASPVEG
jgi:hypothetical protein